MSENKELLPNTFTDKKDNPDKKEVESIAQQPKDQIPPVAEIPKQIVDNPTVDPELKDVKILLRDINTQITKAWAVEFQGYPNVQVSTGDIFKLDADSIVSPANSYGYMDGGIDWVYSTHFGWDLQERLQKKIKKDFNGLLPVGQATIVPTNDEKIPYLISAPTMTVPMDVSETINAYLAFKASLEVVRKHNEKCATDDTLRRINSILCPGLGTMVGLMPGLRCAFQMKQAYHAVVLKDIKYPLTLFDAAKKIKDMMYYEGPKCALPSASMPKDEVFIEKNSGLGFTEKAKYVKKK